jgi:hypothetical protein
LTDLEFAMLQHMKKIVYEEFRPFSYLDFLEFTVDNKSYKSAYGTIKNKFSKFGKENKIIFCYKDKIAFYSLPGKGFGKDRIMTEDTTDILLDNINNILSLKKAIKSHPIYKLIQYIPFGKRSVHDLHLIFEAKGLWKYLVSIDYFKKRLNSKKTISFGYFQIEKYLAINLLVQDTDTVNVTVRCSTNPIILDPDGIMRLTEALTRVEERLVAILNDPTNKTYNAEYNPSEIKIPNKDEWTVILWHLNRDSLTEYSNKTFHCSWRIAKNLFIRVYSKELNLKTIVRAEIQENPDIIFKQIIAQFIRNGNKSRLVELLD